jgi:hypothetical protein
MVQKAHLSIVLTAFLFFVLTTQLCDSKKNASVLRPANTFLVYAENAEAAKLIHSASRVLYHGVHPGSADGDETSVEDLDEYVREVGGKEVAFVYISQEFDEKWLNGPDDDAQLLFPIEQVRQIRVRGAIPFIRLMIRNTTATNEDTNLENLYTYDLIIGDPGVKLSAKQEKIRDKFRRRIIAWAAVAKQGNFPLFVEWGTEVNGKWFWWNARWNADGVCATQLRAGRVPDAACHERLLEGTRKFRRAFQRLRSLVNVEGKASNVKWVFHVSAGSDPNPASETNAWNSIENYYPGADCPECVDAIGVSAYGAQTLSDDCGTSFKEQLGQLLTGEGRGEHDSLKNIGQGKKILVLEFGHTLLSHRNNKPDPICNAAAWTRSALETMFDAGNWPQFNIVGFAWWNEAWVESKSVSDMRIQHFDLCKGVGKDEARNVKKIIPCDCWLRGGLKCLDLRSKRDALRNAFEQTLAEHAGSLRTRPDDTFLR